VRRISRPRVHRPMRASSYSAASRSASSQYTQSCSRAPLVPSPAGQALPSRRIDGARDLFRRAGDRRFALPGAEVVAGISRLGAHPSGLAPLVPQQSVQEQTRRRCHPLLREQRPDPRLHIPQRRRPQLQRRLDRGTRHP
jgi:hypothetical protein